MNILHSLITPTLNFIVANHVILIIILTVVLFLYFGFWITTLSLKKLKVSVFSYYPFDRFFPASGSWSVLYFLITIILLGVIIYFLAKGGFYLTPA